MKLILRVNLKKIVDHSYNIVTDTSLSAAAKDFVKVFPSSRFFIITDSNIKKLYGNELLKVLRGNSVIANLISIPTGEKNKTRKMKEFLEDQLLFLGAERNSVIVALGGGVIGDLAGFVAATLHRGVPYVQIPTTLLAQVDSSIGGKVAIDHPLGKNLIGAFHQPKKVYIDVSTLKTLPEDEFLNGIAEVIKYGVILDKQLFSFLEKNRDAIKKRRKYVLTYIIKRCCELKKNVVEQDEKEVDLRRILNFGHTVGHAIEILSNYKISHGKAISIGMIVESKISVALGLLPQKKMIRLKELFRLYSLPVLIPPRINLEKLFAATLHDKKARGGVVYYTLFEHIGKARIGMPLTHQQALKLYRQ